MKKLCVTGLLLIIALALLALPVTQTESAKMLSRTEHQAGSISASMSNYNHINELIYQNGAAPLELLSSGASWISAKRYRRDEENRRLYWIAQIPSADSSGVTYYGSPLWNPGLNPVVDTLSSIGFDGDADLYEFLPAYNPLSVSNPLYDQFNALDRGLISILGSPAPRPFQYPDPLGSYCFTYPPQPNFETPGFETISSDYYDFCPFGNPGQRDLGQSRAMNDHVPLGLAMHQESYAWNLQNFDKLLVIKRTLYNTSTLDTLFDLAIAEFMDPDILPEGWGETGAADDVSGYVKGLEFAYSRDQDGDSGASTTILASKLILPGFNPNRCAWYWKLGDGPDDNYPLSFNFVPRRTANEKYYLSTGRNPNDTKFQLLRLENPAIMEYEQPAGNDTRFLNVLYGNIPTAANSNPTGRLQLAPGASLTYYSVLFVGDTMEAVRNRAAWIDGFIAGGLELGNYSDLTCIPYLLPVEMNPNSTIGLVWHSYTDPDHFEIHYKPFDAPASAWEIINVEGNLRSYNLSGIPANSWIDLKLASVYNPGPNEVYLESVPQLIYTDYSTASVDPELIPAQTLSTYPNPFSDQVNIRFELSEANSSQASIFNAKGQLVRNLGVSELRAGTHILNWDGRDDSGRGCANGIYFLRLELGKEVYQKKILILK